MSSQNQKLKQNESADRNLASKPASAGRRSQDDMKDINRFNDEVAKKRTSASDDSQRKPLNVFPGDVGNNAQIRGPSSATKKVTAGEAKVLPSKFALPPGTTAKIIEHKKRPSINLVSQGTKADIPSLPTLMPSCTQPSPKLRNAPKASTETETFMDKIWKCIAPRDSPAKEASSNESLPPYDPGQHKLPYSVIRNSLESNVLSSQRILKETLSPGPISGELHDVSDTDVSSGQERPSAGIKILKKMGSSSSSRENLKLTDNIQEISIISRSPSPKGFPKPTREERRVLIERMRETQAMYEQRFQKRAPAKADIPSGAPHIRQPSPKITASDPRLSLPKRHYVKETNALQDMPVHPGKPGIRPGEYAKGRLDVNKGPATKE